MGASFTTDNIRPLAMYVESDFDIEPGHIVEWSGIPNNIIDGERNNVFSTDHIEYAMSKVIPAETSSQTVAGVVMAKAATTGDTRYTHKGGIHTTHPLPTDIKNIYRIGRDIGLAWVIDNHHGELEGLYTRYKNGVEDSTGPYQLTMTSKDHFTIERTATATAELQLAELIARFDALTSE